MTRRDFDDATKQNWGGPCMARDERASYRASRHREHNGSGVHAPTSTRLGLLERRAAWHAWRNSAYGVLVDGYLPTLAIGSKWRNVAAGRRAAGSRLLG